MCSCSLLLAFIVALNCLVLYLHMFNMIFKSVRAIQTSISEMSHNDINYEATLASGKLTGLDAKSPEQIIHNTC